MWCSCNKLTQCATHRTLADSPTPAVCPAGVERSFEELRAGAWLPLEGPGAGARGAAVAAGLASTRYPGTQPLQPAVEQQQPEPSPAKPMEADCSPQRAGQAEALEVAPAVAQHSPQATVVAEKGQPGAASDAGAGGAAGGQELLQEPAPPAAVDDGGFKVGSCRTVVMEPGCHWRTIVQLSVFLPIQPPAEQMCNPGVLAPLRCRCRRLAPAQATSWGSPP